MDKEIRSREREGLRRWPFWYIWCLLCNHEDLHSHPYHPCFFFLKKKLGVVVYAFNCSTDIEKNEGFLWLADQ